METSKQNISSLQAPLFTLGLLGFQASQGMLMLLQSTTRTFPQKVSGFCILVDIHRCYGENTYFLPKDLRSVLLLVYRLACPVFWKK
jgi:hypothetical protein